MPEDEKQPETQQEPRIGWRDWIVREIFNEEKQELLHLSEISLIINEYNDIFSDFDPRPYSQRSLSDDFLSEAKKAAKVKTTGEVGLTFLVPENVRKTASEGVIKKRLHEYFKKHNELLRLEIRETQVKGIKLTLLGFGFLFVATYMRLEEFRHPLAVNNIEVFFATILEPAGWFTCWTGLEQVFLRPRERKDDFEFYEKMARAKIEFISY